MIECQWGEVNWLFNVTINDISVIHVTAHRCAGGLKKKLDLRSGSQRHRHFVGFFNVPVQAPTRGHLFIRWFRHTAPFSRLLRSRWGYGGHILDLTPRALCKSQMEQDQMSGGVTVLCWHAAPVANHFYNIFNKIENSWSTMYIIRIFNLNGSEKWVISMMKVMTIL